MTIKAVQENVTPLKNEKIKTTTRLITKLMAAPEMADKTMMCLEKFNFRNKSPRLTIDTIPIDVASEKKPQITLANKRATGKWGTSPPKRKNRMKTIYMIVKVIKGFKIDQR